MLVSVMPINDMFFKPKKIFKKSIKIALIPLSFFVVFVLLEVPGFELIILTSIFFVFFYFKENKSLVVWGSLIFCFFVSILVFSPFYNDKYLVLFMFFVSFLIFLNFPPRSLMSKKTLFYCVALISFSIVVLCGGWVEVVVYCVWSVFSYVYFYVYEGSSEKIIRRVKLVLKKF